MYDFKSDSRKKESKDTNDQSNLAAKKVSSRSRAKRHLRAQAQLSESRTETLGLLRKTEKKRAEKDGGSRAGVPVENSWKPIC
ncbi:hypothetical protein TNCV_1309141 [Trichonephila clavipes]|nr:hypothetical protein TNCV_1309141 [Trichonephila clavipes]